jgi:hypothetical protein
MMKKSLIAILAFCGGTAVSFFTLPMWVIFAINVGKVGDRSDWLGFFGSIIGATMTIVAALIAWSAVDRQTKSARAIAESEKTELLALLREDLDLICRAANLVWLGANRALEGDPLEEITRWRYTNVLTFITFLPTKADVERIAEASKGLSPLSRRRFDGIMFCLRELSRVTNAYTGAPPQGHDAMRFKTRMLKSMQLWFSILAREVGRFDSVLEQIFKDTTRVEIGGPTFSDKFDDEWQSAIDDEDWIRRKHRKER